MSYSSQAGDLVDDIVDMVLFVQEILDLDVPRVNLALKRELMESYIFPFFVDRLVSDNPRLPVIFLLGQLLGNLKSTEVLHEIINTIFSGYKKKEMSPRRKSTKFVIGRTSLMSRTEQPPISPRSVLLESLRNYEDEETLLATLCIFYLLLSTNSSELFVVSSAEAERTTAAYLNDDLVENILESISKDAEYRLLLPTLAVNILSHLAMAFSQLTLASTVLISSDLEKKWRSRMLKIMNSMDIRHFTAILCYEVSQEPINLQKVVATSQILFPKIRQSSESDPLSFTWELRKKFWECSRAVSQWLLFRKFNSYVCTLKESISLHPADNFSTGRLEISLNDVIFDGLRREVDDETSSSFIPISPTYIDLSARSLTPCTIQLQTTESFEDAGIKGYFVFDDVEIQLVEPNRLRLGKGTKVKFCHILDVEIQLDVKDSNVMILEERKINFLKERRPEFSIVKREIDSEFRGGGGYDIVESRIVWKARLMFPSSQHQLRVKNHILVRKGHLIEQNHDRLNAMINNGKEWSPMLKSLPLIVGKWEGDE
ncbi:hypothetical protein HK098_001203 [Nowakowskiella sp. JEL0407]|nr:hypothetical protein HK098_001203 [Nowakowskiella sp. JEL0407]